MDGVFWWTGVLFWAVCGIVGALYVAGFFLEFIVKRTVGNKVIIQWYYEKLKTKHGRGTPAG